MSNKCKLPPDQQKIADAFKRTLMDLSEDEDQRSKSVTEYDPKTACDCNKG